MSLSIGVFPDAPQCRQRSLRASSSIGRCSVNAGAEIAFHRRRKTTGWRQCASMDQRTMHGLGFYMPRYSGRQSFGPSSFQCQCSGQRCWNPEIIEVSQLGVNVLFRARIAVETLGRGTRRRGVCLLLWPWPLHHCSEFGTYLTSFCCSGWVWLCSGAMLLACFELFQWPRNRTIFFIL